MPILSSGPIEPQDEADELVLRKIPGVCYFPSRRPNSLRQNQASHCQVVVASTHHRVFHASQNNLHLQPNPASATVSIWTEFSEMTAMTPPGPRGTTSPSHRRMRSFAHARAITLPPPRPRPIPPRSPRMHLRPAPTGITTDFTDAGRSSVKSVESRG